MSAIRIESDSFGNIEVPNDKYWGAQTQRSIKTFPLAGSDNPLRLSGPWGWSNRQRLT